MKYFNIHGLRVRVNGHNENFETFISENLYYFEEEEKKGNNFDLEVKFKKKFNKNKLKKFVKIGKDAFQNENRFIFFSKGQNLIFEIEVDTIKLSIKINYFIESNLKAKGKRFIRNVLQSKFSNKLNYLKLSRELINFPIFWLLEKRFGIFLLHGGSISRNNKGIVFSGLANIGKSTNIITAVLEGSYNFLGDNFLLYDENYIYAFPELLRLSEKTVKLIIKDPGKFKTDYSYNGRKYYKLPCNKIELKIAAKKWIIPSIGNYYKEERVLKETFINLMMLSNDHVKEFHNYSQIGLLDFSLRGKNYYSIKLEKLNKLLEKAEEIKKVSIDKNMSYKESFKRIQGEQDEEY